MDVPSPIDNWPPSLHFDDQPDDIELTCLLQAPHKWANLEMIEEFGVLRVRAKKMPALTIILATMLGTILMTIASIQFLGPKPGEPAIFQTLFWLLPAFLWLIILPFVAIVLAVLNHRIAEEDDVLRVNIARRTLEICWVNRTLKAAEILAFTDVSRYFRYDRRGGEWTPRTSTGVLVRGENGAIEFSALAKGAISRRLAGRLAAIFDVPLRQVVLNKAESKALGDC